MISFLTFFQNHNASLSHRITVSCNIILILSINNYLRTLRWVSFTQRKRAIPMQALKTKTFQFAHKNKDVLIQFCTLMSKHIHICR